MYCIKCGKKLVNVSISGGKSFDGETGEAVFHKYTTYKCIDYMEGVSDRYWNNGHTNKTITEEVDNIDGLDTSLYTVML